MNILVTGGAGFIGSHLVERLLKDGHNVVVVDKSEVNIARNLKDVSCKLVNKDVNQVTENDLPPIDAIVHLAALADIVPSIENPKEYYHANVNGTMAMLELARRVGVKKFVYAASGSCYGDKPPVPTKEDAPIKCKYPYAMTKWLGETLAMHYNQVYKLPVISLRLFNVFGPRSRTTGAYGAVFGVFLKQKLENKPCTIVGDGYQSRDFVFVHDVVDAFTKALMSDKSGEIYNIGSGAHTTIKTLAQNLGFNSFEYVKDRPGEPKLTLASIGKAQKDLGWNPATPFSKGCKIMLENIDYWKDAPLWDKKSIEKATKTWFDYMGSS